MTKPLLILASTSPRRRELLRQAGLKFEVIAPSVEEGEPPPGWEPAAFAKDLGWRKAMSVQPTVSRFPAVILGADTIVVLDGQILGKPRTLREAFEMLRALSERTHVVITGVALLSVPARPRRDPGLWMGGAPVGWMLRSREAGGRIGADGEGVRRKVFSVRSRVRIQPLTDAEIRAYHRRVDPLDKAGAYGLQEPGEKIVESVAGSVSNVVGLPMEQVLVALQAFGVQM